MVSWARKKGYALSGTSASLYSTRLATARATTAADAAAAAAGEEPIAHGRAAPPGYSADRGGVGLRWAGGERFREEEGH